MTKQTVWLSKYALTGGVKPYEADVRDGSAYPGRPFMSFVSFKIGRDAHLSKDDALKAAAILRDKKIAGLKKQIAKLEAMSFEAD